MGKIIISQNVTLDGVVQDPTGEEDFSEGGWFFEVGAADREAWVKIEIDEALSAEALLLGRGTDQWFAERWLSRSDPWADRLNSMPKYVVSSTLDEPRWSSAPGFKGAILSGDVVAEVTRLKQELAGDIVVYASNPLVQTLLEHDLADELRLTVYPVVLGSGTRLFSANSAKRPLRLTGNRTLGDGLAYLTYERAR